MTKQEQAEEYESRHYDTHVHFCNENGTPLGDSVRVGDLLAVLVEDDIVVLRSMIWRMLQEAN